MRLSVFHGVHDKSAAPAGVVLAALLLAGCANSESGGLQFQALFAPVETEEPAKAARARGGAPLSDRERAQRSFARGAYGRAEKQFRAAIERDRDDPEAWLGLAATYDRLGRYDLADRAYAELNNLHIDRAVLLNNRGFSYLLRGDHARARKLLAQAQALAPGDRHIARNVALLEERTNAVVTGSTAR